MSRTRHINTRMNQRGIRQRLIDLDAGSGHSKIPRTGHIDKRMNQRGIKQQEIDLTLEFGDKAKCKRDAIKCSLTRKRLQQYLDCLDKLRGELAAVIDKSGCSLTRKRFQQRLDCLDKLRGEFVAAIDKGGLVVVMSEENKVITAYRPDSYRRQGRKRS